MINYVFPGEQSWDNFIVDNENMVSAEKNAQTIVKIITGLELLAKLDSNTVGFTILRNQVSFSETLEDSKFIKKDKYENIAGLSAFQIYYSLQLLKYPM